MEIKRENRKEMKRDGRYEPRHVTHNHLIPVYNNAAQWGYMEVNEA